MTVSRVLIGGITISRSGRPGRNPVYPILMSFSKKIFNLLSNQRPRLISLKSLKSSIPSKLIKLGRAFRFGILRGLLIW